MGSFSAPGTVKSIPGWYRGDFHVHTDASDGDYPISLVVELARAEGLDFIAITDHNTTEALAGLSQSADFLVIPGLEVTLDRGHFNVFGINSWHRWMKGICGDQITVSLPDRYHSVMELLTPIAEQELLVSINHPFLHPWEWLYGDAALDLIHCVELWNDLYWPENVHANPKTVAMWTNWLNAGYRITAIGGSDYHYSPRPEEGKYGERLGYPSTYVYAENLSSPAIIEGLRQGRAYVSKGPRVTFWAEVRGARYELGADLGVIQGEVVFFTEVSYKPKRMQVQLVKNGGAIAHARLKAGTARAQFRIAADPTRPDWYRVDVLDEDGQVLAITNPIFMGPRRMPEPRTYGDFTSSQSGKGRKINPAKTTSGTGPRPTVYCPRSTGFTARAWR